MKAVYLEQNYFVWWHNPHNGESSTCIGRIKALQRYLILTSFLFNILLYCCCCGYCCITYYIVDNFYEGFVIFFTTVSIYIKFLNPRLKLTIRKYSKRFFKMESKKEIIENFASTLAVLTRFVLFSKSFLHWQNSAVIVKYVKFIT